MRLQLTKIAQLLGHNAPIYALSRFKQPHTFLSGGSDGYLVSWDLQNLPDGRLEMRVEGCIFCIDFFPERNWAAVGTMQGGIYWLDLEKNCLISQQFAHEKGVFSLKFIQNRLFSCGADGCLSVWDLDTQKRQETLHISPQTLRNFVHLEEKNQLIVGASGGNMYVIDTTDFSLKNIIPQAHNQSIFSLFYDPKRAQIWTGGRDAYLKCWKNAPLDVNELPNCLFSEPAHLFCINSITANPSLELLATASRDKTVRIWDMNSQQLLKSVDLVKNGGHLRSVNSLLWANNELLISASDDKSLIVWEIKPVQV